MRSEPDLLNVIDVEATCWPGNPPPGQASEIIEIGLTVVSLATAERLHKHRILVRPRQSTVSEFCTELTGLTQAEVDTGVNFPEACAILATEHAAGERPWTSWGDYDRKQFQRQCTTTAPSSPHPTNANPPSPHQPNTYPPRQHPTNLYPASPQSTNVYPVSPRPTNLSPANPHPSNTYPASPRPTNLSPPSSQPTNTHPPSPGQPSIHPANPQSANAYPFSPHHTNAKAVFATAFGLRRPAGMARALEIAGLPLQGRHHRGDDDSWNIAALVLCLLSRGAWPGAPAGQ
ncbi:3'-5' exonuclease [Crossiella cryophila]|uniref:Inhibitor of KinA sporulation pathway (Predicted exonuclease) n=1 Tax=Crossiella cryophila TaxID=43355 RepID=A0A7W7CEH7_9PSEU|nr:3'-5' exonuclease [Crossiella cryophila]MBB4679693.1 inhibitor of KinA sporulation pathway (predicted exonuclease) [Crossiella cryophila]